MVVVNGRLCVLTAEKVKLVVWVEEEEKLFFSLEVEKENIASVMEGSTSVARVSVCVGVVMETFGGAMRVSAFAWEVGVGKESVVAGQVGGMGSSSSYEGKAPSVVFVGMEMDCVNGNGGGGAQPPHSSHWISSVFPPQMKMRSQNQKTTVDFAFCTDVSVAQNLLQPFYLPYLLLTQTAQLSLVLVLVKEILFFQYSYAWALPPCQVKQSHGFSLYDLTAEGLEICVVWEVDLLVGMVCAFASEGWQKETAYVFYEEDWIQFF